MIDFDKAQWSIEQLVLLGILFVYGFGMVDWHRAVITLLFVIAVLISRLSYSLRRRENDVRRTDDY